MQYIQGDTDEVFFGEGTGGSRSATLAGSAFYMATEKVVNKARAVAAHMLKVDESDLKFDDGVFSTSKTNRTLTIKELAGAALDPKNLPQGMEPGLTQTAVYTGAGQQLSERLPHLPRSRSTARPARSISCATAWWTISAPCSIR